MSEAIQNRSIITNARAIDTRAAEWIEQRDFANWSSADQAALDAWLAESLVHRVAFLRLESGWRGTARLSVLRSTESTQGARARLLPRLLKSVGALIVLALLGLGAANYLLGTQEATYATPLGGHRTITLADGTRVDLKYEILLIRPSEKLIIFAPVQRPITVSPRRISTCRPRTCCARSANPATS